MSKMWQMRYSFMAEDMFIRFCSSIGCGEMHVQYIKKVYYIFVDLNGTYDKVNRLEFGNVFHKNRLWPWKLIYQKVSTVTVFIQEK